MRNAILVLTLLAWCARADDGCPTVSFPSVRSATLTPSPTTHRILLRQGSTYTAYEAANTPPYGILRTIPHFEKQLRACMPATSGIDSYSVLAVGQGASGGYMIATAGLPPQAAEIAVFDAGLNLVSAPPLNLGSPLAFADLNSDGYPDLIGVSYAGKTRALAIALGNDGASFQPPVLYPIAGSLVEVMAVAVADLNGDHKPDLVVLFAGPGSVDAWISVFFGNGDGTFQPEKRVTDAPALGAMAVADLNGDGHPDLVFTGTDPSNYSAVVEVALGAGDGTFAAPVPYAVAGTQAVAIGDLNGDGIPDIVTSGITILFGDGKGGFPDRRDIRVEAQGNLIVTDFDGDGIADVVVATGNPAIMAGNGVSVLSGLGKGVFAGPPVSLVPGYPGVDTGFAALATADVNGDGVPDLVSVGSMGVAVLKGTGDGSFRPTFQFTFGAGLPWAATFADFNRDGRLDLAVVGSGDTPSSTGEVDILPGNGDGTFLSPIRIPVALGAFALIARDFNGDGKTDLAVLISREASGVSDGVQILLGNGDGTFIAGALYPVGPWAHSLAAGDFNGDGKLDLAVADAGTYDHQDQDGNIALLAGKGDGTFAPASITPLTGGFLRGPYDLIAADFNGDGKLDLAVTLSDYSNYKGGLVTMLGRGDGSFQPPVIHAVNAVAVQAGDLNGDGIPDLIVSGSGEANGDLQYLLGNADGSFQPAVPFSSDLSTLYAESPLALADFNRDGKLDVAAIAGVGVAVFLNASGPTPPVTVVSAASLTQGPVAADSLATAFGKNFAASPASVSIEDSTGATFPASILYASQSQINFAIPAGLDAGPATVTIGPAIGGSTAQSAAVVIAPVAPSLFAMNEEGLAAAYVTRVASNGVATNEPVFSVQNGVYAPAPIDVTSAPTYLILFGTGIRNAVSPIMNGLASAVVTYAGPQPTVQGLDQVNLFLPASLAGSGCSNLMLTNRAETSNAVYVCIR